MPMYNFTQENSIVHHFLAQMRNIDIQNNRRQFRQNMYRLGQVMAYEISKTLQFANQTVETPLGQASVSICTDKIVLATILRAGLPLHEGILDFFEEADNAFIAAYRKNHKDGTFEIKMEYITCPDLTDAVLILIDPMLATGASIIESVEALSEYGQYKSLHIATAIASVQGIKYITRRLPKAMLWIGAEDDELTAKSYIVPGLGDAGDLAFGKKMQE